MPLPILETARLVLRVPELQDLDRWADMMQDVETCRYIGGVQARSMVWRSMMSMIGAWHCTGISMFSVVDKQSGLWLGRIGPWRPEGWPGDEVGWALHPDSANKGYATEAASACMTYAANVLKWKDIIHTIDPANTPSQKLAERLGSRMLGPGKLPSPYEHVQVEIWGQSAEQWSARNL